MKFQNSKKDLRRRTVWNYLHDATPKRSRAVVLYLAGEGDFDRPHVIRRGFMDENLIAVESDPAIVRALRLRGVNVIPRPLLEVVAMWPLDFPVSGLLADLQCGLEVSALYVLMLWQSHPAFWRAMLYLNLQRGREHNEWAKETCESMREVMPQARALSHGAATERHRGMAAMYALLEHDLYALTHSLGRLPSRDEARDLFAKHIRVLPPYRSSHVTMDGVIAFNRARLQSPECLRILIDKMSGNASTTGASMVQAFDSSELARTRRCISAALAIRTARMRCESRGAPWAENLFK